MEEWKDLLRYIQLSSFFALHEDEIIQAKDIQPRDMIVEQPIIEKIILKFNSVISVSRQNAYL